MTRHISWPAAGEGLGAAGSVSLGAAVFGMGAGTAVSTGSETEATPVCVVTSAGRPQLRPRMRNTTAAAPTRIHFGKPDEVARSGLRRWAGGGAGASLRTTAWGKETWAAEIWGTGTWATETRGTEIG